MPISLTEKVQFGARLLHAKVLGTPKPLYVQMSITTKCNLACSYCYAVYPERPIPDVSTEDWCTLIDELAEMGCMRIALLGGEPLIRRDIDEIITHIKSRGITCAMTSNGYMVPSKIDAVKKLDCLAISLDGNKEAHDKQRGNGSWEKAMRALDTAYNAGVKVQIATVLTKHNLHDLNFLFETAAKYNCQIGFATLVNQTWDGVQSPIADLVPPDREYKEVLKKIIEAKEKGAPVLFSKQTHAVVMNWPHDYAIDKIIGPEPKWEHPTCQAGNFYCIIDANGDIYPCPQWVGARPAKNAFKDGLKAAWDFIHDHNCRACVAPCSNELNYMFSLDPRVIFNMSSKYKEYNPDLIAIRDDFSHQEPVAVTSTSSK